jgi:hypothetical protein
MFDKKLRDERPSNDEIFSIIKKGYEEKIGADVDIDIKEEETIIHKNQPRIISKVDRTNFRIKKYI